MCEKQEARSKRQEARIEKKESRIKKQEARGLELKIWPFVEIVI
jgi:hypothetical protein